VPMKILHMMLSSFYIDNYSYQENILPKQNAEDGHEVMIIASTESFIDNQRSGYVASGIYTNRDGIEVRRLPYSTCLPRGLMNKVRSYSGVYAIVEEFGPDVILFHGSAAWELLTVARYKRNHPDVRFFMDSHSDRINSGTNFFSKWLLHRIFYRSIIQRVIPYLDRVFYISLEAKDFLADNYGVPDSIMEFFPLGGLVLDEGERKKKRDAKRLELNLKDDDILFIHTGKMDALKRTESILKAFSAVQDGKLRLVLIGSIPDEIRTRIDPLIQADNRVSFLGWKNAEDLLDYLCACDMYVQPGSQSATMQNAMCVYAAVMLYPHRSHIPYLDGNGYFVKSIEDMSQCFQKISRNPGDLEIMRRNSERLAKGILDYRRLAARLYQ
jgi:glycosyltransferase involved in cell wall biosynthesis